MAKSAPRGRRVSSSVALAILATLAAAIASPTAAQAAKPVIAFDGRCDIYGEVTFRDRVTTEVTANPFVFHTADRLTTCAGPIRVGDRTYPSRTRPARVVVRGKGDVSCQNSTASGLDARLKFLKRGRGQVFDVLRKRSGGKKVNVVVRTTASLEHILNSVVATVTGAGGTSAVTRATFLPTPEAIQRCGEDGIRSLPFNGTILTTGELVGE